MPIISPCNKKTEAMKFREMPKARMIPISLLRRLADRERALAMPMRTEIRENTWIKVPVCA